MSKSKGNVVNPDEIVQEFGADTLRLYEMFMGPFEDDKTWNTESIKGVFNFLKKVWALQFDLQDVASSQENQKLIHHTIKKVTEDIENFRFNTAISALMILVNGLDKKQINRNDFANIILLISPLAPHIAEEMWQNLGNKETLAYVTWPDFDEKLAQAEIIILGIQVNGKLRDTIELNLDTEDSAELKNRVLALPKIQAMIASKEVKKYLHIKNKIISIVV